MVVAGFEHEFAQIPESHRSGVELLLRQRLGDANHLGEARTRAATSSIASAWTFSVTGRLTSRAVDIELALGLVIILAHPLTSFWFSSLQIQL